MWDITGISDDTVIGRNDTKKPKKEKSKEYNEKPPITDMEVQPDNGKILIDEDENMNMNGHGHVNGNIHGFNNVEDYNQRNARMM